MSIINVGNYSGIIGSLNVTGALTAGSFALTTGLGYIEAYNDATTPQSISNLSNNVISFNTIATNTFSGSVLTVSGTNNTTFTNVSASPITIAVTFSVNCSATTVIVHRAFFNISTNARNYGMFMMTPNGASATTQINTSSTLYLPAGASFQAIIYPNATGTITSGTNTSTYINMITIKQMM